jgi:hypothetical protein
MLEQEVGWDAGVFRNGELDDLHDVAVLGLSVIRPSGFRAPTRRRGRAAAAAIEYR